MIDQLYKDEYDKVWNPSARQPNLHDDFNQRDVVKNVIKDISSLDWSRLTDIFSCNSTFERSQGSKTLSDIQQGITSMLTSKYDKMINLDEFIYISIRLIDDCVYGNRHSKPTEREKISNINKLLGRVMMMLHYEGIAENVCRNALGDPRLNGGMMDNINNYIHRYIVMHKHSFDEEHRKIMEIHHKDVLDRLNIMPSDGRMITPDHVASKAFSRSEMHIIDFKLETAQVNSQDVSGMFDSEVNNMKKRISYGCMNGYASSLHVEQIVSTMFRFLAMPDGRIDKAISRIILDKRGYQAIIYGVIDLTERYNIILKKMLHESIVASSLADLKEYRTVYNTKKDNWDEAEQDMDENLMSEFKEEHYHCTFTTCVDAVMHFSIDKRKIRKEEQMSDDDVKDKYFNQGVSTDNDVFVCYGNDALKLLNSSVGSQSLHLYDNEAEEYCDQHPQSKINKPYEDSLKNYMSQAIFKLLLTSMLDRNMAYMASTATRALYHAMKHASGGQQYVFLETWLTWIQSRFGFETVWINAQGDILLIEKLPTVRLQSIMKTIEYNIGKLNLKCAMDMNSKRFPSLRNAAELKKAYVSDILKKRELRKNEEVKVVGKIAVNWGNNARNDNP